MGDWNIPGRKAASVSRRAYCGAVPKLFLRFPDGVTGVALLLIRLSSALTAFGSFANLGSTAAVLSVDTVAAVVITLALVTGFFMRAAALILTVALAATVPTASGEQTLFLLASACTAGALAALGAGAYSVDAHRYGRRVILLDPRSPDQGTAN
jgi:putative oxidoreductase